jgi:hypothetical protein
MVNGRTVAAQYVPVRNRKPVSDYTQFEREPKVVRRNPNLTPDKVLIKPFTRAQHDALLINVC